MTIPGLGDAWVRPVQYGTLIECYENRPRDAAMFAVLFRRTLPGFEDVTPADVRAMDAWVPGVLELAIHKASETLHHDSEESTGQPEPEYDRHGNKLKDGIIDTDSHTPEIMEEFTEADLIYQLHDAGYTFGEIYRLTFPEISLYFDGQDRHAERKEIQREQQRESGTNDAAPHGSRAGTTDARW